MDKKVFVIIVTFNGMKWVENCLNSVLSSSIPIEVIVIDNNSTDGTIEFIKTNFKNILFFEQNQNLGFGAANNIGLNIALENGGEYFVLLNQDAYLEKNTIRLLIEQLELNKDYGVLSPIHLNGKGDEIDLYFQYYVSPSGCENFYSDVFLKKNIRKIYDVNFVNAAIWLVSKNTLEKVGGFNTYFFHYAEDNDYINRCRFKKIKVGIVPEAIAYHDRVLNDRKFDLKTFINVNDLKLMDPGNYWSANKMIKFSIRKIITSIIKLNKKELFYNFCYIKKTLKNYNLIISMQQKSKTDNYPFLNNCND